MQSIAAQLAKIAKRSQEDLENVARASLIRLGNLNVQGSPVDTGRFKNNWMSAFGQIDLSIDSPENKAGQESLTRLTKKVNHLDLGQTFLFTNSLPYAIRLEYGWSAQATGGVVRRSVLEWERIVTEEVRKRS